MTLGYGRGPATEARDVLGGEPLRRALIGGVFRLGVLGGVATVGCLLRNRGAVYAAVTFLLYFLDVLYADGAAASGAEGPGFLPRGAFPRNDQG